MYIANPMQLLVYGSQEFGRLIKELATACKKNVVGFIDDISAGDHKKDVLGSYEDIKKKFKPKDTEIVIAIGYKDLAARKKVYEKVIGDGYRIPTLVHPQAYVSSASHLDHGNIVMVGATIDAFCKVGRLCVFWPGSVVNHDSLIEENSFISPNATLCGFTRIGASSFVGAGAVIVDRKNVPPGSFVKAGTVFK